MLDVRDVQDAGDFICLAGERAKTKESKQKSFSQCGRVDSPNTTALVSEVSCCKTYASQAVRHFSDPVPNSRVGYTTFSRGDQ